MRPPDDSIRQFPGGMVGVILCGGESRRMGRDKGLLQTEGRCWALRMGDKLSPWIKHVVYSINKSQFSAYSALIPENQLVVDTDEREGPMNGLFSVWQRYFRCPLLLLACDMQDLDKATLQKLIAAAQMGSADCYAYEIDDILQPFCAIYMAQAFLKAGTSPSLRVLLNSVATERLQGDPAAFRNYNTL